MIRILTHVHLYYTEMWPEIKSCLTNLFVPYDLFVTITKNNDALRNEILRFKPDATIVVVENRGFDVAPFINILNRVNLNDYDYIIKLHTKRNMPESFILNDFNASGNLWREHLLNFIRKPENFKKCLTAFETTPELGMVSDFRLICKKDKSNRLIVSQALEKMKALSLPAKEYSYVMGTMFMARAKLFQPLLSLQSLDFEPSDKTLGNTNSFIGEILFGFAVNAQGYQIKDVLTSPAKQFYGKIIARLKNFIWRKKTTASGKTITKICEIPVFVSKNKGGNYAL